MAEEAGVAASAVAHAVDTHQPKRRSLDEIIRAELAPHAPVPKYEWNEEHTQVFRNTGQMHMEEPWVAGFLDLILVAGLLKLGDGLYHCGLGFEEYAFSFIEFLMLFQTRYIIDEYMWHFYMDDVWNQTLYFLFVAGLFIMTLMMSYSHETDATKLTDLEVCHVEKFHMNFFHWGIVLTRAVVCVYWIVDLVFDVHARDAFYMMPVKKIPAILVSLVALAINTYWHFERYDEYILLFSIVVCEYYLCYWKILHQHPLINLNRWWPLNTIVKKHPDHSHPQLFQCEEELEMVQERCGMFMLLVFGESMIQLLIPSFGMEHRYEALFLTLSGLLLVWSVAKGFFDAAHRAPHDHALRRSEAAGKLWIVLHAISGFFTFIMGIGIKLLYKDMRKGYYSPLSHELALSVGCGVSVLCHIWMRFLHKGWGEWPENKNRLLGYAGRVFLACLHFTGVGWHIKHAELLILVHCLIAAVLNGIELYFYVPEEHVADHGNIPAHLVSEKPANTFFTARRERAANLMGIVDASNSDTVMIGGMKLKPKSPDRNEL